MRLDEQHSITELGKIENPPNTFHYSFDFAHQLHYPATAWPHLLQNPSEDPLQPGPIFFRTPRKIPYGLAPSSSRPLGNCPRKIPYSLDPSSSRPLGRSPTALTHLLQDPSEDPLQPGPIFFKTPRKIPYSLDPSSSRPLGRSPTAWTHLLQDPSEDPLQPGPIFSRTPRKIPYSLAPSSSRHLGRSPSASTHLFFQDPSEDPLQPGLIFFKTLRKMQLFAAHAKGISRQMNYLIDEASSCGKGANVVISTVHHLHATVEGRIWRVATGLYKSSLSTWHNDRNGDELVRTETSRLVVGRICN